MDRYPSLEINHEALKHNASVMSRWCKENGILFCAVIKSCNGILSVAKDYVDGGAEMIASSRLEQLRRCKEAELPVPLLMIRVPMLSEASEVVRLADYSLNSEEETLIALNEAAREQGRIHKVILMADLGDLREGWFDQDELVRVALRVENELGNLELAGVGTNLGCYGSVVPDENNMNQLAELARRLECEIGRKLEIVSGGASSSLKPLMDGVMPSEVNMLRIGAVLACGPLEDVRVFYDVKELDELRDDCFILKAQVIEKKIKPTHPIGTLGVDAFGKKREYEDRGNRMRVLLGIGRQDYGDIDDLVPMLDGARVLGASGDHTIVDIEDCDKGLAIGDIIECKLKYSAILRLTASEDVKRVEIN